MNTLALKMLPLLVGQFLKVITPDMVRELAGSTLDKIEEMIVNSENRYDDMFLPAVETIRKGLKLDTPTGEGD